MDHDKLFKQLLKTFFVEFISLFVPELLTYLSRESIEFLDKEIFTDLADGSRSEVDLIAKCRFQDGGAFFMIHVEDQNSPQSGFARRMFHYFARLDAEHGLPVYPIAVLTYDTPRRPEPDHYDVAFPDMKVLGFRFRTIQLNRMNWKDFTGGDNPVAAALMTKMQIDPGDRAGVKLACVRMMLRLPLNPAQRALIQEFLDAYLRLNPRERVQYEEDAKDLEPREKENVMAVMNEWTEAALEEGFAKGRTAGFAIALEREKNLLARQLHRQIGELSADARAKMTQLEPDALEDLGEALLDMKTPADLEAWFNRRA